MWIKVLKVYAGEQRNYASLISRIVFWLTARGDCGQTMSARSIFAATRPDRRTAAPIVGVLTAFGYSAGAVSAVLKVW
jgi:hypothetical protein